MKRKFPVLIAVLIILLLSDVVVSALILREYNRNVSLISLISAAALVILFLSVVIYYSRKSLRHISKMNEHLENSTAAYMNSLPAPIAVVDENGLFIWHNQTFGEKIAFGNDVFGLDVRQYVNFDIDSISSDGFAFCSINGCFYRIYEEKYTKNDISLRVLYFHDETDYFLLKKAADETHPTVLIINIDNYDEIMQNAKQSDKARTSVETEQLLENFMADSNGVLKKINDNTFYAVLEDKHINEIINEKFKILDEARNIKIGERTCLTMSIGVGQGAASLAESERFARQCLDMALGRGGDQAVVKTDSGYRFFGGVSKGVEKKSRAKTRIIANTLQDIIMGCDKVYIMGHRFGDLDSIGSAAGLAGAVRLLGKNVFIVADLKKNLAVHLVDLIKQETNENFFISPAEAAGDIGEKDLLIVVDTHNKDFIESTELYNKAKTVVVIDHHRKNVNFIDNAVIFHHEPYASSASEMVTELVQYFRFDGDAQLPSVYADALLAGITLDTKNFVMRTGVRTFEAAAFLKKIGADTVNVKLLFSNSIDSYRRKTQIVASAKIHNHCAIAAADFRSDDIRLVAPQAADELLGITDVSASFVLYRTGDTINISARSMGAMNVQVVMEHLGGGGHQTMAAVQLENISINDAMKMLTNAIDETTGP